MYVTRDRVQALHTSVTGFLHPARDMIQYGASLEGKGSRYIGIGGHMETVYGGPGARKAVAFLCGIIRTTDMHVWFTQEERGLWQSLQEKAETGLSEEDYAEYTARGQRFAIVCGEKS